MAKEKPPIFGMLQRGGAVVIRMLANVNQVTIGPLIKQTITEGSMVYTDEYDIYSRLVEWGYGHETVCHAKGEYARDDDGDDLAGHAGPRRCSCGGASRRSVGSGTAGSYPGGRRGSRSVRRGWR